MRKLPWRYLTGIRHGLWQIYRRICSPELKTVRSFQVCPPNTKCVAMNLPKILSRKQNKIEMINNSGSELNPWRREHQEPTEGVWRGGGHWSLCRHVYRENRVERLTLWTHLHLSHQWSVHSPQIRGQIFLWPQWWHKPRSFQNRAGKQVFKLPVTL